MSQEQNQRKGRLILLPIQMLQTRVPMRDLGDRQEVGPQMLAHESGIEEMAAAVEDETNSMKLSKAVLGGAEKKIGQ